MFRELINTPVYPVSIEYINGMTRVTGEPDLTLTMLGLACFKKRIQDYKGISGLVDFNYKHKHIVLDGVLNSYKKNKREQNTVEFYYCSYGEQSPEEKLEERYKILSDLGFKHKETVEKIIKSKFETSDIEVFYNTETNAAIIVTNRTSHDLYHLVLSFLPLYYPNIYINPISKNDPEVQVLSSLSKNTSTLFKKTISEILSEYKQEFFVAQLKGLWKTVHDTKIFEANDKLARAKRQMDSLYAQCEQAVITYRDAIAYKEGVLKAEQGSSEEDEIINYLASNEQIRNIKVNGSRISFSVATTLMQFDTDAYNTFARNGSIYNGSYGDYVPREGLFADKANRKRLFDSIFSEDPVFEVKIAGNYSMNIQTFGFSTSTEYDYKDADPIYENYLPNPHLKIFGCLGQYHPRVVNTLKNGDLMTALELCVYSAGSVDLDETEQTFRPFLGWIMKSDKKILRTKDGVDVTPTEALLSLIDKEK